ncbi:MAG TPA: phosphatase PAP2 family protein [Chitinophagaceae bacterium]|jgi:undecaprenyl-diphosphatase|nr:phosphatase PAP2 family protein [Chitinophagaceae bacterium]HNA19078.1 phosphatase PAP2 family protein [Chitinophagaceae bacterium]HNA91312.1 phosphatase PAP2 family protein [Chitinophagaceae bacterium]HNA95808.1 phosphatase PAP2 family protein [Chitinophagaceae bacterium]HNC37936.1 phosphatase PAP2 family protein [Chitinophagaceae bacterium]
MKLSVASIIAISLFLIQSPSFAQQKKYAGLDYLHKLQDNRTEGKNSFNKFMSGTATPVSLATPFSLWIAGMVSNNKKLQKDALFSLESFALSQAFTFGVKAIVNKPRPHEADPTLIALKNAKNGSFPSGHTSEAFATATSLTLITKKWYVAVPAYSWASLVGYSRMYLGVHYPADVLGGALLGTGSAFLSYKINQWLHPEKKKLKNPND